MSSLGPAAEPTSLDDPLFAELERYKAGRYATVHYCCKGDPVLVLHAGSKEYLLDKIQSMEELTRSHQAWCVRLNNFRVFSETNNKRFQMEGNFFMVSEPTLHLEFYELGFGACLVQATPDWVIGFLSAERAANEAALKEPGIDHCYRSDGKGDAVRVDPPTNRRAY